MNGAVAEIRMIDQKQKKHISRFPLRYEIVLRNVRENFFPAASKENVCVCVFCFFSSPHISSPPTAALSLGKCRARELYFYGIDCMQYNMPMEWKAVLSAGKYACSD